MLPPSRSERNGCDMKGLSIVLRDVKSLLLGLVRILCGCHRDQVNPSSTAKARPFLFKGTYFEEEANI